MRIEYGNDGVLDGGSTRMFCRNPRLRMISSRRASGMPEARFAGIKAWRAPGERSHGAMAVEHHFHFGGHSGNGEKG